MERMRFMNTTLDNVTMSEALQVIDALAGDGSNAYVVTPNVDHIVRIEEDAEFRAIYDHANMVLADGKPLLWIAHWYGTPIKEKISGSDLFPLVCQMAAQRGYRVFFLGAKEGVAARAARVLEERYPGLQVVGTYSPPLGFENDEGEVQRIIEAVRSARPNILILGLGTPKQEKFLYHHLTELGVPISLGLGASFDFVSGNVRRAPRWMSDHGLEWLFRLVQEPKRMAKRYLVDDMRIIPLIWKYRPQRRGHL